MFIVIVLIDYIRFDIRFNIRFNIRFSLPMPPSLLCTSSDSSTTSYLCDAFWLEPFRSPLSWSLPEASESVS